MLALCSLILAVILGSLLLVDRVVIKDDNRAVVYVALFAVIVGCCNIYCIIEKVDALYTSCFDIITWILVVLFSIKSFLWERSRKCKIIPRDFFTTVIYYQYLANLIQAKRPKAKVNMTITSIQVADVEYRYIKFSITNTTARSLSRLSESAFFLENSTKSSGGLFVEHYELGC